MKLTLACSGSDMGYSIGDNTYDEFLVKGDGKELFRIRYTYSSDEGLYTCEIRRLTDLDASLLPGVVNQFHLAGLVYDFLLDRIRESGNEFFNEEFTDEKPELEIDFSV